jgi:Raf kinase inhibitor-like YbhB/YbcL family protein
MKSLLRLCPLLVTVSSPALGSMILTSEDIKPGAPIPAAQIYTRCGGTNVAPQLRWRGTPAGTKSLVLTMIDISVAPSHWSHWVITGLPPQDASLTRGTHDLPPGARTIKSNFGDSSYDGPCPPRGSGVHRYLITIWALPTSSVSVDEDMKATDLEEMLRRMSMAHASIEATAAAAP